MKQLMNNVLKWPDAIQKWVKVFKNGPSKICGRQPLKNFTWFIIEYLDPKLAANVARFSKCVSPFWDVVY